MSNILKEIYWCGDYELRESFTHIDNSLNNAYERYCVLCRIIKVNEKTYDIKLFNVGEEKLYHIENYSDNICNIKNLALKMVHNKIREEKQRIDMLEEYMKSEFRGRVGYFGRVE